MDTIGFFSGKVMKWKKKKHALLRTPINVPGTRMKVVSITTDKNYAGVNKIEGANWPADYRSIKYLCILLPELPSIVEQLSKL